jgi:hypothetical protein
MQAPEARQQLSPGCQAWEKRSLPTAQDLGYGETQALMAHLEEVSRLLNRYAAAILTPGSWLLILYFFYVSHRHCLSIISIYLS